ncbi:MAG: ATP-dependent zinc metalloprotease FtsH [Treponema sp.]|uniref:ATP-dependent zinc metalloprotease FtsH n=1 Tax=Treponema sp. TaxID=166 RepID=UPI0025E6FB7F|nr:ATP-dependent zinc metalloprotease FtsH [Treponema sp.]MBQ9624428.1 ATP-dependent zinc metalloprotease FtsH [Treponema sp.]MBR0496399.1 ATP-dependent zinc metalloprotease FtsH [Treponema sp.]
MADTNETKKDEEKKNFDKDPYNFFKLDPDSGDDDQNRNKKPFKFPFFTLMVAVVLALAFVNMFLMQKPETLIDFSEFKKLIDDGKIVQVEMGENVFIGYGPEEFSVSTESEESLALRTFPILRRNQPQPTNRKVYKTTGVLMAKFIEFLDEKGIQYKFVTKQTNIFVQILINILPFLILLAIYFFMFRKMTGGMGGLGSVFGGGSRNKAVDEGKVKTRFADVAGVDEAKDELVEVVDFLKSPKKYTDIGGKIPKGVLLVGPPGTGKTLLARAVAGEAGVPFFRISGSDFVEMFVGVGASRVRDLFKQAREKAPCIIFIDEIDAIGKSRMNGFSSNDEREQTLNQLLVEMDGFDNEKGLIILAATNRADILDPALLRPGRFDRQVPVERPDVKGREAILRIHAKNVKLDDTVDFESLAHGTVGFAGADLANVVNEAALLAVRNGHDKVSMTDFNEAIDKVSIGLKKKSRKDNEKEIRLVAVHETGHALVAAFTPDHTPVNKITVVPRSHGVGGFTQFREEKEEKNFLTRKDMINEVDSSLGGRAAEEIVLGDISTGASNDIAQATDIIKRMITDYGMSDKFKNMTLGKGVLGNRGGEPNLVREFSEATQNFIDEEIARIMNERYEHVLALLRSKKDLLEYIANRLIEVETMDSKEFNDIIKAHEHCEDLAAAAVTQEVAQPESKEAE